MRILETILLITFVFGCKSIEKQRRQANYYFDKYPGELAARCDKQFPIIDSVGELIYDTSRSNNKDYKAQTDSLSNVGDEIAVQLFLAKRKADSISNECADVVLSYMWDIERLNKEIKRLVGSYKPCTSDTINVVQTVYRRSTARESVLDDSLSQYKYQLGVITDESNKQIKEIEKLDKEKGGWMWKAIGTWIGMFVILGGILYMYIKK